MVDEGYSEVLIQKEDERKVREFDMFLERTTLRKNSLSSLAEKNMEIKRLPELRIVLVGKVSTRSKFPSFSGTQSFKVIHIIIICLLLISSSSTVANPGDKGAMNRLIFLVFPTDRDGSRTSPRRGRQSLGGRLPSILIIS